jgi:hypothetical protein
MAAIMVLISGWIGLAYAVVGHIMTDSAMMTFLGTWAMAGGVALAAFGLIAVLRRFTAPNAPIAA